MICRQKNHSGQLSRADLLEALLSEDEKQVDSIARQLNLSISEPSNDIGFDEIIEPDFSTSSTHQFHPNDSEHIRPTAGFWRLESWELHELPENDRKATLTREAIEWTGRPADPPKHQWLCSFRTFMMRLSPYLQTYKTGFKPDVGRLVLNLSEAKPLHRLPALRLLNQCKTVQVIDDRHTHLTPYWQDYAVLRRLIMAKHQGKAQQAVLIEGQIMPRLLVDSGWLPWSPPKNDGVVIILSDLGALSQNPEAQIQTWINLGVKLQRSGCKAIVFMPCSPSLCDKQLKNLFVLETLAEPRQDPSKGKALIHQQDQIQTELLLDVLSPVIRLEPGLLRQMRLEMAVHGKQWKMDAAIESLAWQHSDLQEPQSVAASWHPEARANRLQRFAQLSLEERGTALNIIKQWRQPLAQQIWFEEITSLDSESRNMLADDVCNADAYFSQLSEQVQSDEFLESEANTREWLKRVSWRMPDTALENSEVGQSLQRIKFRVLPDSSSGIDPRNLPLSDGSEKQVALYQQGREIRLELFDSQTEGPFGCSLLGEMRLRRDLVRIEVNGERVGELRVANDDRVDLPKGEVFSAVSDLETLHFDQITRPQWASRFARNKEGLFAESEANDDVLRWAWYPRELGIGIEHKKRGVWYKPLVRSVEKRRTKIFISYTAGDRTIAHEISAKLHGYNYEVSDERDIRPGKPIILSLEKLISESDATLFITSPEGLRSDPEKFGALYILEKSKKCLPILLNDGPIPDFWPNRTVHKVNNKNIDWKRLLSDIENISSTKTLVSKKVVVPKWAKSVNRDQYGFFTDAYIRGVKQVFRWIEPEFYITENYKKISTGTFERNKRYINKAQHGFWMADTAVTQELWQVLMSDNPSHFKNNQKNPVEKVSWHDAQDFIKKLNSELAGLSARLPLELEWEHACRAGSESLFSFGNNITYEQANIDESYWNSRKNFSTKEHRVFISYSHDSKGHNAFVLSIADRLRKDGVECHLDQYVRGDPTEGWLSWMESQIKQATVVLMVCTQKYLEHFVREKSGENSKGVAFEAKVISQELRAKGKTSFIPVIKDEEDQENIPLEFKGRSTYALPRDYKALYRVLSKQSSDEQKTSPVKSYPSNAWGLYEMHGNVWEWCQDELSQKKSRFKGGGKIVRGGAWNRSSDWGKSSAYAVNDPFDRYDNLGFRLIINDLAAKPTVLIIDSEKSWRTILSKWFTHFGFAAITAGSYEDAIKILNKNKSVDLISTEVSLSAIDGGNVDGLQIINYVDDHRLGSKVAITSGYPNNAKNYMNSIDVIIEKFSSEGGILSRDKLKEHIQKLGFAITS